MGAAEGGCGHRFATTGRARLTANAEQAGVIARADATGDANMMDMPHQASLEWPGADEVCPKYRGIGNVYYLPTRPQVVGGKRVACPVCAGSGSVRKPLPAAFVMTPGAGTL